MIEARAFIDNMNKRGFGPYIGVPCSFIKSLVNYIISNDEINFITVNNEGEALAIAAGAYLSGKKPVVMLQNSGLGNMVNPITSLTYTFQIPILLIVTLRGEPGSKDEPQHELMGEITQQLLDVLKIPSNIFPHLSLQIEERIQQAEESMHINSLPFAMIMKKGSIDTYKIDINPQYSFKRGQLLTLEKNYKIRPFINRAEAISLIDRLVPSSVAIISSTGMISRELFYCNDSNRNFYTVGSMGCTSNIGLGVALYQKNRKVVVLDGDGAALMRLEAMVSIGHYFPKNIVHIILDNLLFDSTGGQATLADSIRFDELAIACGYASAVSIVTTEDIENAVARCLKTEGPHLVHIRLLAGHDTSIGRPTVSPVENKHRFMNFLSSI